MDYMQWLQQRQQPLNVPNSPMPTTGAGPGIAMPQGQQQQPQGDAALAAMLAIEGLSPQQKKMQRQRAQAQQLRDMALGGDARHWTGVLAQGLAGGLSGYQDRKLDPEEERINEERRRAMERIGGSL
jgi:hypothetical protein